MVSVKLFKLNRPDELTVTVLESGIWFDPSRRSTSTLLPPCPSPTTIGPATAFTVVPLGPRVLARATVPASIWSVSVNVFEEVPVNRSSPGPSLRSFASPLTTLLKFSVPVALVVLMKTSSPRPSWLLPTRFTTPVHRLVPPPTWSVAGVPSWLDSVSGSFTTARPSVRTRVAPEATVVPAPPTPPSAPLSVIVVTPSRSVSAPRKVLLFVRVREPVRFFVRLAVAPPPMTPLIVSPAVASVVMTAGLAIVTDPAQSMAVGPASRGLSVMLRAPLPLDPTPLRVLDPAPLRVKFFRTVNCPWTSSVANCSVGMSEFTVIEPPGFGPATPVGGPRTSDPCMINTPSVTMVSPAKSGLALRKIVVPLPSFVMLARGTVGRPSAWYAWYASSSAGDRVARAAAEMGTFES